LGAKLTERKFSIPVVGEICTPDKPSSFEFTHTVAQNRHIFTTVVRWSRCNYIPHNRPRIAGRVRITFPFAFERSSDFQSSLALLYRFRDKRHRHRCCWRVIRFVCHPTIRPLRQACSASVTLTYVAFGFCNSENVANLPYHSRRGLSWSLIILAFSELSPWFVFTGREGTTTKYSSPYQASRILSTGQGASVHSVSRGSDARITDEQPKLCGTSESCCPLSGGKENCGADGELI
jgi:hypothetical protein